MESIYYNNMSDDEIYDILAGDLKTDELPHELRGVAEDILSVEFASRDIMVGFLKFCDGYEKWIEATGGELVKNYIRASYNMNELGFLD
jgi:hypothetical protein